MNDRAGADPHAGADTHTGIDHRVLPDFSVIRDRDLRHQDCAPSDPDIRADHAKCADTHIRGDLSAWINDCRFVNARRNHRGDVKVRGDPGHCQARALNENYCVQIVVLPIRANRHRSGPRLA